MSGKKKIKITKDGPYEVSSEIPLKLESIGCNERGESMAWEKGKTYAAAGKDGVYSLCRCGRSHDKPFCDGAHNDCEFCGRERADRPAYEESAALIPGATVDLLDDESLCVGARFCDPHGTIWKMIEFTDDPKVREMVIQEACDCPGGRLTIVEKDGGQIERKLAKEISATQDPVNQCRGPLWVKGGIEIEGADGEKYQVRNRVALCRCGESQNMPYCDASHYKCPHMQGVDE